ncbi:unnamed protein product [Paramecium sonneborni]|uniref:Uncharacterized protein n=1 Tax=Paramecium sonneborni TaxID=65129 RepID=A0A8S1RKZ7_9CILI|nr:unnamed protein product [Paramecium sonneborni]
MLNISLQYILYDDQKQRSVIGLNKIDRWVELIYDYRRDSQNGKKKVGEINFLSYYRFELMQEQNKKITYWWWIFQENDLNSIKQEFKNWLQVIMIGEYKNGQKVGC